MPTGDGPLPHRVTAARDFLSQTMEAEQFSKFVIPVVTNIFKEAQGGQVVDEFLVNAELSGEVEVVEGPRIRQAGEPQPSGVPRWR